MFNEYIGKIVYNLKMIGVNIFDFWLSLKKLGLNVLELGVTQNFE